MVLLFDVVTNIQCENVHLQKKSFFKFSFQKVSIPIKIVRKWNLSLNK